MAVFPELKIRKKIMVARRGEKQWFLSTIQDIKNGELFIEIPRQKENALILYPGEEVEVKFTAEGASYLFTTRCLGKKTDRIPLFRLTPPENIQRIQQRQFVRFPVALPVLYAPLPEKDHRSKYKKAVSVDLSGGGIRLAVKEQIPEGALLHLKFSLPLKKGAREISTAGRVVRQYPVEPEGSATFQVAIEFLGLSRTEQDSIVSFVFRQMLARKHLRP